MEKNIFANNKILLCIFNFIGHNMRIKSNYKDSQRLRWRALTILNSIIINKLMLDNNLKLTEE
jgi:hypothetical protein